MRLNVRLQSVAFATIVLPVMHASDKGAKRHARVKDHHNVALAGGPAVAVDNVEQLQAYDVIEVEVLSGGTVAWRKVAGARIANARETAAVQALGGRSRSLNSA